MSRVVGVGLARMTGVGGERLHLEGGHVVSHHHRVVLFTGWRSGQY